jgi:hypothetical protein
VVQKYLSARGHIGWVRANSVEVAKTGRFGGKNRTLVQILCLQRVGSCKTGPYFSLLFLVLLERPLVLLE